MPEAYYDFDKHLMLSYKFHIYKVNENDLNYLKTFSWFKLNSHRKEVKENENI